MNPIYLLDKSIQSSEKPEKMKVEQMLPWLQHERLIHLLVMLTTGIATVLMTLAVLFTGSLVLGLLAIILSILFLAYVLFYRKLELMVYRWYDYLTNQES